MKPITAQDQLLTTQQAASLIGKSDAWLVRKRWEGGGIPYRKIGRHVRYQLTDILEWLNAQPRLTSTSQQHNNAISDLA